MDGRQSERAALYDREPAARTTRAQLREDLVQAGLYPHAVHVVGEGSSEKEMVWRLVAGLIGRRWADELGFTDLGGVGSASRLNPIVSGFTTYAQRTVVVVGSEGAMTQYVTRLIRSGELSEEDVLRFETNLEDSNFTPAEMLDVLVDRAVLDDMLGRCDRLRIAHSGIQDTPAGPRPGLPDPDGAILRFYHFTDPTDGFTGIETRQGRYAGTGSVDDSRVSRLRESACGAAQYSRAKCSLEHTEPTGVPGRPAAREHRSPTYADPVAPRVASRAPWR